ncbi:MAG: hypothetical protein AAF618_08815 [Pseudomonadota bacterium]
MGLHANILDAHGAGAHGRMVALYTAAADAAESVDEEMFFLTHAYIFALETGDARAPALRQRLSDEGRI